MVALARFFNDARVVPDRSGPTGEVLARRMVAEGYRNIWISRDSKKIGSPSENKYGVWLNAQLRTTILQQYRDAIGRCAIVNRSEFAMDECLKFIVKQDGSIEHSAAANSIDPSGARTNHGDLVIGDALANLALSEARAGEDTQSSYIPPGSVKWRMEAERREHENGERELGEGWEV